jgi:hypothetical protein
MIFAGLLIGAAHGADFSMSAGGGGFAGGHFTRYELTACGKLAGAALDVFSGQEIDQLNLGGCLFFDAAWAEFNISLLSGASRYSETMYAKNNGSIVFGKAGADSGKGWETMLGMSLLGKWPFKLNALFTAFPLLGVDYQIALRELRQPAGMRVYDRARDRVREQPDSDGNPYKLSAWNALFVVLGGGLDFYFYRPFFLRAELLYSIRLQTPWETDSLEKVKKMVNAPNPKLGGLSSGPTLKLAVGWRFFG